MIYVGNKAAGQLMKERVFLPGFSCPGTNSTVTPPARG